MYGTTLLAIYVRTYGLFMRRPWEREFQWNMEFLLVVSEKKHLGSIWNLVYNLSHFVYPSDFPATIFTNLDQHNMKKFYISNGATVLAAGASTSRSELSKLYILKNASTVSASRSEKSKLCHFSTGCNICRHKGETTSLQM